MAKRIDYKYINQHGAPPMTKLLAPYRCKVYFKNKEWGIFGRGSLHVAGSVAAYNDTDKTRPAIVVGDFCEAASHCQILLGGEHYNDKMLNNAFTAFPLVRHTAQQSGQDYHHCFSRGMVRIGHNVILSHGVSVRSGVSVGTGAVLGAGAVVLRDVPEFSIVAGVPAEVIKQRFDDATIAALKKLRWWDWKLSFLLKHFSAIHYAETMQDALRYGEQLAPEYEPTDPNFVVLSALREGETIDFQCLGIERSGVFTPIEQLPENVRSYMDQAKSKPGEEVMIRHHLFD